MRHLYEPPASLLPLVRANLFSGTGLCSPAVTPLVPELQPSSEGEAGGEPGSGSPYYLVVGAPPGAGSLHSVEVPRLDGLALSFLLGTPSSVDYPRLYCGLLQVLRPLLTISQGHQPALYCFLILWRLLQALPPPVSILNNLLATANNTQVTHTIQLK